MKQAGLVHLWLYLGLATYACAATRELDLFQKKPRKPEPEEMPGSCEPPESCTPAPPAPSVSACSAEPCLNCGATADCTSDSSLCVGDTCVECRQDANCSMKKVCNTSAGNCTEPCAADDECKDKARSVCDVARGWCVQCVVSMDCDDKHVCDTIQGTCVGCQSDVDCSDAGICDTMRHECAPPLP